MLAGATTYRYTQCQQAPREEDLTHLLDLVMQLCNGSVEYGLKMLGLIQHVYVSQRADDWLEMWKTDDSAHDKFGEPTQLPSSVSQQNKIVRDK